MIFEEQVHLIHGDSNQNSDCLWGLIGKEHENTFWGDGNILYSENHADYTDTYIYPNLLIGNTQDLRISVYVSLHSIKSNKKRGRKGGVWSLTGRGGNLRVMFASAPAPGRWEVLRRGVWPGLRGVPGRPPPGTRLHGFGAESAEFPGSGLCHVPHPSCNTAESLSPSRGSPGGRAAPGPPRPALAEPGVQRSPPPRPGPPQPQLSELSRTRLLRNHFQVLAALSVLL